MAIAKTLTLEVATPKGLALSAEVDSVQAPSVHGEFGVLPGHLPLLAALRSGLLKYRRDGKDLVAAVGPGFAEAGPTKVTLLVDAFAASSDIDRAAAQADLEAAEKELKAGADATRAEELRHSVEWATARIAAAGLD